MTCLLNNVCMQKCTNLLMAWGLYRSCLQTLPGMTQCSHMQSCLQTKKHDNQLSCLEDSAAFGPVTLQLALARIFTEMGTHHHAQFDKPLIL